MKSLVVYYSLAGTTRACAMAAARELGAELAEIATKKPIKAGNWAPVAKMMLTGRADIKPVAANPRDYDLIVVATPIWAGGPSKPVTTWLKSITLMQKSVGFLATCDSNEGNALHKLEKLCLGARVVGGVALKSKHARPGELEEQARLWADELLETLKTPDEGNA